ncbi:hypothetical protein DT019_37325 [Streptomyces sp. SDr-06]|nr:hypothetical protein DT019_37325 [Streptomyces sp. SDr-06]
MGSGADNAGDDMVVGRTNQSEERTILVAKAGDGALDGYGEDFVLRVAIENDKVLRGTSEGVDAIHAKGTIAFPGQAAGNGMVATGANGVVGYVHGAPRDKEQEQQVQAGVLGFGGTALPGVFGRGAPGVLGYGQGAARDAAWEAADPSAVLGRAEGVGIRGKGEDGGVRGESENSFGVEGKSTFAPGVHGQSALGIGVLGEGAPGVSGLGPGNANGGQFESQAGAQLRLLPRRTDPLSSPLPVSPTAIPVERGRGPELPRTGRAGELTALQDPSGTCTLWLCVSDLGEGPARWAQVLLGPTFDGRA